MARRLEGKVAVVTGGGSGIGRVVSLDLCAQGAQIVINDLGLWTPDKPMKSADQVVDEIRQMGGKAVANCDDVSTMAGAERIIKTAIDTFGRIDILVCCAGITRYSLIEETTEADWDRIIGIHVKGHFGCIKYATPHMKRQKSGRIITISSIAAFGPTGGSPAYDTAKAAILGLTRSAAKQLGKYGITVNAILPSAMTRLFPKERAAHSGYPAHKGKAEDVSPMIVYLATDEARDINGQFFYVGGGTVALLAQARPYQMLCKEGRWTVDELAGLVPQTFGVSMVNPSPAEQPA